MTQCFRNVRPMYGSITCCTTYVVGLVRTLATGVSGISRSEKFSAGGNPNNPYTFGKLMSRRSDLAQLRVSNCFSSAFICSFLKGPYQGVDDIGKNGFTALAKNRKNRAQNPMSIKSGLWNCFMEGKKEASKEKNTISLFKRPNSKKGPRCRTRNFVGFRSIWGLA